MPRVVPVSMLP